MSYILDAIRKADQQRRRDAAPTLLTAQDTVAPPGKPAFSLNGWLAAALIVAGIVIGWLRPWQTEPIAVQPRAPGPPPAAPASRPVPAVPSAPMPAPALPEMIGNSDQPPPARLSASATPAATESAGAGKKRDTPPAPARIEKPPPPPGTVTIAPREAPTPMPEKPGGAGPNDDGQEKKVLPLSDLPPSVRQEIPNLTISFHVYVSNPAERRVMINNKLLRQGEVLEPGLGVEQITPDGVVLSYKGYRFRRGVR